MEISTTTALVQTALEISPFMLGLVPVIVALVQVVKLAVEIGRFGSLLALGFGLVGAFLFPSETVGFTILNGLILGLSASGLYSGYKGIVKDVKREVDN